MPNARRGKRGPKGPSAKAAAKPVPSLLDAIEQEQARQEAWREQAERDVNEACRRLEVLLEPLHEGANPVYAWEQVAPPQFAERCYQVAVIGANWQHMEAYVRIYIAPDGQIWFTPRGTEKSVHSYDPTAPGSCGFVKALAAELVKSQEAYRAMTSRCEPLIDKLA
jgi:hypothetical protein